MRIVLLAVACPPGRLGYSFQTRLAHQRPDQDLPHDQVPSPFADRLRSRGPGRPGPAGRCGRHAAGTPASPAGRTRPVGPGSASAPPIGAGAESPAASHAAPAAPAHGAGLILPASLRRRHRIRYRPFPGRPMPTRPQSLRGFGPSARPQQCGRAFLFLASSAEDLGGLRRRRRLRRLGLRAADMVHQAGLTVAARRPRCGRILRRQTQSWSGSTVAAFRVRWQRWRWWRSHRRGCGGVGPALPTATAIPATRPQVSGGSRE